MAKINPNQICFIFPIEEKIKIQERSNRVPLKIADLDNIIETLPLLLPHQHENVYKAEKRFFTPPEEQLDSINKGIMYTDNTGSGKAQPLNAKLLTPSGWVYMGDIKIGDEVMGSNGHPCKITGVFPQGKKEIFRVTFSDGSCTHCCNDHLWLTQTRFERKHFPVKPNCAFTQPKIRSLKEIKDSIDKKHFIPIVKQVQFKKQEVIIDPYLLGVLLGDGSFVSRQILFASFDDEITQNVKKVLPENCVLTESKNKKSYCIKDLSVYHGDRSKLTNTITSSLINLGLLGLKSFEKFIPTIYLFNSVEVRISILQGLMDTDGTIKCKEHGLCCFGTSSKRLADDVIFIVQSLGGTAKYSKMMQKGKSYSIGGKIGQCRHDIYQVRLNIPEGINPFRLGRKAQLYQPNKKYKPRRRIISIESVGFQEAQCISVDSLDHLYVTDNCILTHNTYSGLGIVKRFERMNIRDILIVVPTDSMCKVWILDAKNFGLNLYQLKDTKDAGRPNSMVITTYANFRQNLALQARANAKPFGLVMYDEAHKISSNEHGASTEAEGVHKLITNAPDQAMRKARDKYQPMMNAAKKVYGEQKKVEALINAEAKRLVDATKVVFLSATPFSYHKSLSYADGYLFRIRQGEEEAASSYKNFFVSNFGYRVMYHKLTEPDAKIDVGLFERQFHTKLVKAGCVSSTRLRLDMDYSREFILIDDYLGTLIDEGYKIATDHNEFEILPMVARERFSYLYKSQLLECIKAKRSIPRIQKHLALGRKVIVFHSYVHSVPAHPFDFDDESLFPKQFLKHRVRAEIDRFHKKYPQFRALDLSDLKNPIQTFQEAFGDRMVIFNGSVPTKHRIEIKNAFNNPDSGKDIFLGQMEATKEGLSLHDTIGTKPRSIVNLALPIRPSDSIQTEGRGYRVGQKSNVSIEYPVLHLSFEKETFAYKINERVKTVENLAFGEQARNLKETFKEGYKNPITEEPHLGQGTGSRDADMVFDTIDEYTMSIKLYYNRGKRNAKTKAREGADYYATPEPIGLKMVEWLYSKGNDHLLEPSAGHGAIARFFPENTVNKFIEPSYNLRPDLAINVTGDVMSCNFEDYHISNKFEGIAMNPPFGTGGKTAWDHVVKAMGHLHNGGRIIAILPEGPSMDTRIEKWRQIKESKDCFITGRISLPTVTFERAGTSTKTQILIIDYQYHPGLKKEMPAQVQYDFSDISNIDELFDRMRDLQMPSRIEAKYTDGVVSGFAKSSDVGTVIAGKHTKLGFDIWTIKLNRKMSDDRFNRASEAAKRVGGYYSAYNMNGAIPGFIFKGEDGYTNALKLCDWINKPS